MSKRAVLLGVLMWLTGGFWLTKVIADPQSPKEKQEQSGKKPENAQVTFDALKKQLPAIVSVWCKSASVRKPQIRIARRTASEEAKITFQGIAPLTDDSECFFTLYLRYYDGAWTVMRWEAGGNGIDQERVRGYMLKLALAVDKATGK